MTPIRWRLAGPVLGLTVPWWLADPQALVGGTGIVAIRAMSVSLPLATRPVVVEPWLGGLDKMYRLHKWLDISALVAMEFHWALVQAMGWAVDLCWWVRPPRGPRAAAEVLLAQWLQTWRDLAKAIGEGAFYAAVALIVLALVKRFPYHLFFKVHRLLAVAYLLLVGLAVVLMPTAHWRQAIAPMMVMLMVAGSVVAVVDAPLPAACWPSARGCRADGAATRPASSPSSPSTRPRAHTRSR